MTKQRIVQDANGEFWVEKGVFTGVEAEDSADKSEWQLTHMSPFSTLDQAEYYANRYKHCKVVKEIQ